MWPASKTMKVWHAIFASACLLLQGVLSDTFVNEFAVHIPGGLNVVNAIAQKHGYTNLGQVHWVEQQKLLSRKKRDFAQRPARSKEENSRTSKVAFNDDLYKKMWYYDHGGYDKTDMNVMGAWKKGITGKNVVITILDDGIERTHEDLKDNYDPAASHDVNGNDSDPMPRYDYTNENRHGTRCAGEVSAKANNTKCIVGVAYDSRIGGVRMLDGDVYDAVEATSLSFNKSYIDIYSASWGPDDDGRVVDGPGPLARKAFIDGITKGRGKKGSIFVWASGNGGSQHDSCNCDGYTNSIYTLSISSISQKGKKPWYLEECSSTLATTFSSGSYGEKQIVTVDLRNRCTETHTGTSASAPLAAGIVALILEVKPDMTWRDVQYITLMTARPTTDGDWVTNGVGRKVSLRYGYGLMDATGMVELAEKWTNVPEKHICEEPSNSQKLEISDDGYVEMLDTSACAGTSREIKFLEHVQAKFTIQSKRRGNLAIYLTSPMGTRSLILPNRPSDSDQMKGFNDWAFLSVHFWGENPVGRWKMEVQIKDSSSGYVGGRKYGNAFTKNLLVSWSLVLHGTKQNPVNLNTGPTVPPVTPSPTGHPGGCHSECEDKCSGPRADQCDECRNFQLADTRMCVAACPVGYYQKDYMCERCASSCLSCTTVSSSEVICLECQPGYLLIEGKGVCRPSCATGYYEDKKVQHCRLCSGKCAACSGSEYNCTACRWGLQLKGSNCIPAAKVCPAGEFLANDGSCIKCPAGCLSCSSLENCTCCSKGSYLKEGNCVNRCGSGYLPFHVNYSTEMVFQQCQQCQNECNICPDGFNYLKGVCVQKSNCPEGTYFQWTSMSCKPCNTSCKACIGPSNSDCLTCYAPFAYSPVLRKCLKCCTEDMPGEKCCPCVEEGKCMDESERQKKLTKELFNVVTLVVVLLIVCIGIIVIFLVVFTVAHFRKKDAHPDVHYKKLLANEEMDDMDMNGDV